MDETLVSHMASGGAPSSFALRACSHPERSGKKRKRRGIPSPSESFDLQRSERVSSPSVPAEAVISPPGMLMLPNRVCFFSFIFFHLPILVFLC